MKQYLNLNLRGGALARLTILHGIAAHSNAADVNMPPSLRLADWRAARKETLRASFALTAMHNAAGVRASWYTLDSAQHFRDERYADEVLPREIDHTGWFADAHQEDKIRGIVGRLSHGRFIAGYEMTCNNERVYFGKVFADEDDAARYGDSEAESLAEDEREHSERYSAAQALDDDISDKENDVAELFPMRHHARARRELADAIDTLRGMRERRAEEFADIE